MIYRRLVNGDYTFGNGTGNFLSGKNAVAQAINTKLKLFTGEWFFDTSDGLPFFQSIAGYAGRNKSAVDRIVTNRILEVPNVSNILNISSTYDSSTREYSFTCWAATIYGVVVVTNVSPLPNQNLLKNSDSDFILDSHGDYIRIS